MNRLKHFQKNLSEEHRQLIQERNILIDKVKGIFIHVKRKSVCILFLIFSLLNFCDLALSSGSNNGKYNREILFSPGSKSRLANRRISVDSVFAPLSLVTPTKSSRHSIGVSSFSEVTEQDLLTKIRQLESKHELVKQKHQEQVILLLKQVSVFTCLFSRQG